jgi:hypothetical protein
LSRWVLQEELDDYVCHRGRILSEKLPKMFPAAVVSIFRPTFIDGENWIGRTASRLGLPKIVRQVDPAAPSVGGGLDRIAYYAQIDVHLPSISDRA